MKKTIRPGFLLIFLGAMSFSAQAQPGMYQPKAQACYARIGQKDLATTIQVCTTAIEQFPSDSSLHTVRGRAHAEMGNFTAALADLDKAVTLDARNADALAIRALVNLSLKKPDAGLSDFNSALAIQPNHVFALFQRAGYYNATGKKDLALADLQKILTVRPNDPQVTAAIKQIEDSQKPYVFKGKPLTAPEMFITEIINLENDAVINSIGAMPGQKKRDPQVFDLLTNCFARFPENHPCASRLLKTYLDENASNDEFRATMAGKWIDANLTSVLATVIKAEPKNAGHYSLRGVKFLYTHKNYQAAIADFTKAMELDPTSNYLDKRAEAYTELKNYEAALADYSKLVSLYPKSSDAYQKRAAVYALQGKFDSALADANQAVELSKSNPLNFKISVFARAKIHAQNNKHEQAIVDLTSIVQADSLAEYAYIERAKSYRATGKTELAAADEKRAEELKQRRLGAKGK